MYEQFTNDVICLSDLYAVCFDGLFGSIIIYILATMMHKTYASVRHVLSDALKLWTVVFGDAVSNSKYMALIVRCDAAWLPFHVQDHTTLRCRRSQLMS